MKKGYNGPIMFSESDISRNSFQLYRGQAKKGYDWSWHSFTAYNEKTGEAKPFFIEFFTVNPAYGQDEPIFGQLEENKAKGIRPSYMMVKVGCWGASKKLQLHRFFGWKQVKIHPKAPFSIEADDCYLDETKTHGHVHIEHSQGHPEWMCDDGDISWDLSISKQIPFNVGYGAGKLFRAMQCFEMFWHAEGMKTAYSGTITLDGERYLVRPGDCYGYADKNWGKDFTSPWVWLSSNNITSNITHKKLENTVFDIGGGRPKIYFLALKGKLLSAFYYEGKCYEFNFSKFWTFARTKFNCVEEENEIVWHVEQKTWNNRIVVDIRCKKEDMLLVNYEAPNGRKRHNRLWNGGNGYGDIRLYHKGKLIDDMHVENVGCEYGEYTE